MAMFDADWWIWFNYETERRLEATVPGSQHKLIAALGCPAFARAPPNCWNGVINENHGVRLGITVDKAAPWSRPLEQSKDASRCL